MAIDDATYSRFVEAEKAAKVKGVSLIEALDYRRLLLTAKRERDISVSSLENVLRRLELQSPNKMMAYYYGRVEGTSSEMFEAIKQWLDLVCRNQGDGTLGDL